MSQYGRSTPRNEPWVRDAALTPFDVAPALDVLASVGRDLEGRQDEAARIGLDRAEAELGNQMGGLAPRPQVRQSLLALRRARDHFRVGHFDHAAVEIDRAIGVLGGG